MVPVVSRITDDSLQRLCRLPAIAMGVVAIAVMQQHDRPRPELVAHSAPHFFIAWPVRIPDTESPPHRLITHSAGSMGNERIAIAMGRAEHPRCDPTGFGDCGMSFSQLSCNSLGATQMQLYVGICVVADGVSRGSNRARDVGKLMYV